MASHLVTAAGTMNIYRSRSSRSSCRTRAGISGARVRIRMAFSLRGPARSRTIPSIVGRISLAPIFFDAAIATTTRRKGGGERVAQPGTVCRYSVESARTRNNDVYERGTAFLTATPGFLRFVVARVASAVGSAKKSEIRDDRIIDRRT